MLSSGSIVAATCEARCRERKLYDLMRTNPPKGRARRGSFILSTCTTTGKYHDRASSDEHVLRASTRRPKGTSKPPACFQTHAAAFMGSRYFLSTWAARRGQQNWLHDIRHVGIVCCGGRRLLRFGAERGTEQEQFVARRCSASAAFGRLPHECALVQKPRAPTLLRCLLLRASRVGSCAQRMAACASRWLRSGRDGLEGTRPLPSRGTNSRHPSWHHGPGRRLESLI